MDLYIYIARLKAAIQLAIPIRLRTPGCLNWIDFVWFASLDVAQFFRRWPKIQVAHLSGTVYFSKGYKTDSAGFISPIYIYAADFVVTSVFWDLCVRDCFEITFVCVMELLLYVLLCSPKFTYGGTRVHNDGLRWLFNNDALNHEVCTPAPILLYCVRDEQLTRGVAFASCLQYSVSLNRDPVVKSWVAEWLRSFELVTAVGFIHA